MSISAVSIGASGMRAASSRVAVSAQNIAQAPGSDIASNIVDVITAKQDYEASARTVRVASDMQRSLLDIFV